MTDNENDLLVKCENCAGEGKIPRVKPLTDEEVDRLKEALKTHNYTRKYDFGGLTITLRAMTGQGYEEWKKGQVVSARELRKQLGADASIMSARDFEEMLAAETGRDYAARHVVDWDGTALDREMAIQEIKALPQAQFDVLLRLSSQIDDEYKDLMLRSIARGQTKK